MLRRNRLLKQIIEGKLQRTRRRGRRCQLLDVPKKERSYWTLKGKHLIAFCGDLVVEKAMGHRTNVPINNPQPVDFLCQSA